MRQFIVMENNMQYCVCKCRKVGACFNCFLAFPESM